jgi:hypothetical protein
MHGLPSQHDPRFTIFEKWRDAGQLNGDIDANAHAKSPNKFVK